VLLTLTQFHSPVTVAAWAPSGESFVVGSQDPHTALAVWDLNEDIIYKWKEDKMRVYDLSLSPDGRRLVVLLVSSIAVYDFITREKIAEYSFDDHKMTCVNISKDSKTMLVSMNPNKIHLMHIDSGEILQSFHGQKQSEYMIRSAFGGANESFVVSGSEGMTIFPSNSKSLSNDMYRFKGLHLANDWPACSSS
jgi:WD40 repeat protein